MSYCPNAQCPYAVRHHEPAEYRDETRVCSDCGATLVSTRPISADPTKHARPGAEVWGRVALTCIVPVLAAWLCPKVPLPGVDHARLAQMFPELARSGYVSAFALTLAPVFSAFILVELVALCVPRWRALRNGGPAARARLLAWTWKLSLALAVVQALGIALYLERMGMLAAEKRLARVLVVFSLVAGTCVFVVLARWLDHAGFGGGFSVLALSTSLRQPTLASLEAAFARALTEPSSLLPILVVAGVTCGTTVLLLRLRGSGSPRNLAVRLPACGVVPLQNAAFVLALVAAGASLGLWPRASISFTFGFDYDALAARVVLIALLAVAWSVVFNRPASVYALVASSAQPADVELRQKVGASLRWAIVWSTAYVLVLGLADWFVGRWELAPILSSLGWAMVAAVALDVVREARARSRLGELEALWPEHRVYAVDAALATLAQAGIPAFARSANHRALWHFFAPFIPVQILVPPARAEEAGALLRERLAS